MAENNGDGNPRLKSAAFWCGLILFLLTTVFFRPQLDIAGLKRADPDFPIRARQCYLRALETDDTETLLTLTFVKFDPRNKTLTRKVSEFTPARSAVREGLELELAISSRSGAGGGTLLTPLDDGWLEVADREMAETSRRVGQMAAVVLLMALWWITVALPIPATSLLPVVLLPLFGIYKSSEIASIYMNDNIMLFMGGFFLARAIERWGLHRRIALRIIAFTGDRPSTIVLGFMLATAGLSMWISNTATTMMMLPIGLAIILALADRGEREMRDRFALCLMLSIAYAASVGGMATLIGTPPNLAFKNIYGAFYPGGPDISFARWMGLGLPLSLVMLFLVWILMTRVLIPLQKIGSFGGREIIRAELRKLGPMTRAEKLALTCFISMALLWIFRSDIVIRAAGEGVSRIAIPGWASLLGLSGSVNKDGFVAILVSLIMFAIPVDRREGKMLLDWDTAVKIPWGILLLFGGGFALARGVQASSLDLWIGQNIGAMSGLHPGIFVYGISTMMTFVTEVTSNTAVTEIMLVVIAPIAETIRVNPLVLMIPATLSASCAFMLPVATPPNAIVFASGHIPIGKMVRIGIWLNLLGILVIGTLVILLGPLVFGFSLSPGTTPSWVGP